MRATLIASIFFALTACATPPVPASPSCQTGAVTLSTGFPQARASDCLRTGPSSFVVTIVPESTPINPSPWYAFDIKSDRAANASVTLEYAESRHRYRPKQQIGQGWTTLPAATVKQDEDGRNAQISLDLEPGRTRIAGQEVLSPAERLAWVADFGAKAGLTSSEIGQTHDGRPLIALRGGSQAQGAPLVIILGGQHPPEVPGVLGLRAFLEALLLNERRAETFLDTHAVLIVPEMNLDGVDRGYWRLNVGLVDLNRDWGPFSQPETQAVRDAIDGLVSSGYRPALMLDFHATRRNVFYTSPDEFGLSPANFARDWLVAINARWSGETPDRSSSHNPGLPTSRSWFVDTYSAPGLTVEFGDEIARAEIDALAEIYADALVATLIPIQAPEDAK